LRGRYAASTPRQRLLSSVPSRARLPATSPRAHSVRRHERVTQLTSPRSSLCWLVFGSLEAKQTNVSVREAAMVEMR